ncbi:MAG TPA: metal-dependent transcriptional regulator [Thermomicrobiaceae bacterium]|nr:metal-dependent transcriptional regulator [Thermomicrobiaceae bacterium]
MRQHDETITHAMEDYLKVIYQLRSEGEKVTTQAIAERLHVQSPSVTNMVKRLAELHLVDHTPYRGVELTATGEKAALEVLRHHRLLELYLAEALGYSWDEVHDEADRMEHTISEEFEARIDRALGYPKTDPHGDPIPTAGGEIEPVPDLRLGDLAAGDAGVVERVRDRDPEKLRYLGSLGLYPLARVRVLERYPFDGPVRVWIAGHEHIIGRELAQEVQVSRVAS